MGAQRSTIQILRSFLSEAHFPLSHAVVVNDYEGALRDHEAQAAVRWDRLMSAQFPAAAWPVRGDVVPSTALVRIPKEKPALRYLVSGLSSVFPEVSNAFFFGGNDEGIKSLSKTLNGMIGYTKTVMIKHRHRLVEAALLPSENTLEGWAMQQEICLDEQILSWKTYPGLFAKGRLDRGTELFLEAFELPRRAQKAVEIGCGTGVLALGVLQHSPTLSLHCVDADVLAVRATRSNLSVYAPTANWTASVSDVWSMIPRGPRRDLDLVISNPPIHFGKRRSYSVVERVMIGAAQRLKPFGELWMVVQSAVPVQHMATSWNAENVLSKVGFTVWRLRMKRV